MKSQPSRPGFFLGKTLLFAALTLVLSNLPAHATLLFSGVDLKTAGRTTQWAMFGLTGGIVVTDTTGNQIANPTVIGDVGASNGSSITVSGTTRVQGTAYIKKFGVLRKSGTATVSGGLATQDAANDTAMVQVQNDAAAAANQANGLANNTTGVVVGGSGFTDASTAFTTVNQNDSLSLSAPAGAHVVLHLTDFILTGGATFTLAGSAETTYIINVSGTFTLLGGKVVLSGGLAAAPENVLFNITGVGTDLSLTSMAQYNGFILATQRTVNVSGVSTVNGTIIAGKVNVSGGSRVLKPTYASP